MSRPLPEGITAIRVPEESELLEVAKQAAVSGMYLISDGHRTVISPVLLPGWYRLGVTIKEAA
jgi:hypothetical protein